MLTETKETKAVLTAKTGRVVAIIKNAEPGVVSLAVPNDRAVLTPAQMRELADWLTTNAAEIDKKAHEPLRPSVRPTRAQREVEDLLARGARPGPNRFNLPATEREYQEAVARRARMAAGVRAW